MAWLAIQHWFYQDDTISKLSNINQDLSLVNLVKVALAKQYIFSDIVRQVCK